MAISVDPAEESREVVERARLGFPILCDTERRVIADYGLVHKGGGPGGSDIALPAHILIERGGHVAWRYLARRVEDRVHPDDVAEAVRSLAKPPSEQSPPSTSSLE